jgi:hypothetical protein
MVRVFCHSFRADCYDFLDARKIAKQLICVNPWPTLFTIGRLFVKICGVICVHLCSSLANIIFRNQMNTPIRVIGVISDQTIKKPLRHDKQEGSRYKNPEH